MEKPIVKELNPPMSWEDEMVCSDCKEDHIRCICPGEQTDHLEKLLRNNLNDILEFSKKFEPQAAFEAISKGAFYSCGDHNMVEEIINGTHDYIDTYPKWIRNAYIHADAYGFNPKNKEI